MPCTCIKCGAHLENVMEGVCFQPVGGTSFASRGHYGSTVFDPMDGSAIEIVICDGCLSPMMGTPLVLEHRAATKGT